MITSKQNEKFKKWMKLKSKKYRDQYGLFLVYGPHLIEAAQKHQQVLEIITTDQKKEGTLIDPSLMKALNQTETMYDVMAVCTMRQKPKVSKRVLALDGVQDPDNIGALIRSASAFGFMHVLLSHQCADLYNEKVIRASKGAIFDVFVERVPIKDALIKLKNHGFTIVTSDAKGQQDYPNYDKIALIMGNEGHGISHDVSILSDYQVAIETAHVESLNVSVAGGIIMHQWRQI